ncbi:hypothetical protein CVS40_12862 [Lucilia cuprina]|nr:hypothetical protein CVS40_12862 [Lucilia cuprina]
MYIAATGSTSSSQSPPNSSLDNIFLIEAAKHISYQPETPPDVTYQIFHLMQRTSNNNQH